MWSNFYGEKWKSSEYQMELNMKLYLDADEAKIN